MSQEKKPAGQNRRKVTAGTVSHRFPQQPRMQRIKGAGEVDVEAKVNVDPFPSMRKVFLVLFYSQGSLGIQLWCSIRARFLNKYKSRDWNPNNHFGSLLLSSDLPLQGPSETHVSLAIC